MLLTCNKKYLERSNQ